MEYSHEPIYQNAKCYFDISACLINMLHVMSFKSPDVKIRHLLQSILLSYVCFILALSIQNSTTLVRCMSANCMTYLQQVRLIISHKLEFFLGEFSVTKIHQKYENYFNKQIKLAVTVWLFKHRPALVSLSKTKSCIYWHHKAFQSCSITFLFKSTSSVPFHDRFQQIL